MPAAIDVNDATKPIDADIINYPASQGAAELRALKAKLNYLLNTVTGVDHDGEFLLSIPGRGMYVNYTATPVSGTTILYGYASNVTRGGGNNHTVAAQFSAYLATGVALTGSSGVFGIVTQSIVNAGASGNMIASEFAICNLANNNTATKLGCNVVFKNRGDGAAAAASGLGANQYNTNAYGFWLTSQPRGTDGAFCGWFKGLLFDEFCMDLAAGIRGHAIDAFSLHYEGGTDPRVAFRVDAVLRMRSMQSILWDDGAGNKVRIYMDPFTGRLTFSNENIGGLGKFHEIDVATGAIYRAGVLVP